MIMSRTIMVENIIHFIFLLLKFKITAPRDFPHNQFLLQVSHSSPYTLSPTHHAKSNQLNSNDRERIQAIQ